MLLEVWIIVVVIRVLNCRGGDGEKRCLCGVWG